jgi:hypothetical protein
MEKYEMANPMEVAEPRTIESRWSIRVPVRLPVIIKIHPGLGFERVRTVTHDLSFDGALIAANHPALQRGAQLRVLLETAAKDPLVFDALVVRSTDHTVGLMFTEYGDDVSESLCSILAAEFNAYLGGRPCPAAVVNKKPIAVSVGLHK